MMMMSECTLSNDSGEISLKSNEVIVKNSRKRKQTHIIRDGGSKSFEVVEVAIPKVAEQLDIKCEELEVDENTYSTCFQSLAPSVCSLSQTTESDEEIPHLLDEVCEKASEFICTNKSVALSECFHNYITSTQKNRVGESVDGSRKTVMIFDSGKGNGFKTLDRRKRRKLVEEKLKDFSPLNYKLESSDSEVLDIESQNYTESPTKWNDEETTCSQESPEVNDVKNDITLEKDLQEQLSVQTPTQKSKKTPGNSTPTAPEVDTDEDETLSLESLKQDLNEMCADPAALESLCNLTSLRGRVCVEEMDIAVALGISPDDLSKEKIENRKIAIKAKLQVAGHPRFSKFEEYDIYTRAEAYATSIKPCSDFCVLQGQSLPKRQLSEKDIARAASLSYMRENYGLGLSFARKRRKRTFDENYYVIHSSCGRVHNDATVVLPEGTKLFRPPNKLVELVAQALNDSPDGMLQVQQVYTAIQNKYPYFKYMDKGSLTSWRSSIRHALYQKWFKKIQFSTDLIVTKGCLWTINRKHKPREWTLPKLRPEMSLPDDYIALAKITEEEVVVPKHSNAIMIPQETPLNLAHDSQNSCGSMEQCLNEEFEDISSYLLHTPKDSTFEDEFECTQIEITTSPTLKNKDPDPILTMSYRTHSPDSQEQELQEYVHSHPSPASDEGSEDSGYCSVWTSGGWDDYRNYPQPIINPLQIPVNSNDSCICNMATTEPPSFSIVIQDCWTSSEPW